MASALLEFLTRTAIWLQFLGSFSLLSALSGCTANSSHSDAASPKFAAQSCTMAWTAGALAEGGPAEASPADAEEREEREDVVEVGVDMEGQGSTKALDSRLIRTPGADSSVLAAAGWRLFSWSVRSSVWGWCCEGDRRPPPPASGNCSFKFSGAFPVRC